MQTDSDGLAEVKYGKHVVSPSLPSRKAHSGEETEIWTCRKCMFVNSNDEEMLAKGIENSLKTLSQESTDEFGADEAAAMAEAVRRSLASSEM